VRLSVRQAGDRRDKIFTVASSDSLVSDSLDSPVARNNTLVQNLSNSNMLSYLDVEGTDISMPDDISVPDANNATQTSSLQIPGGARSRPRQRRSFGWDDFRRIT